MNMDPIYHAIAETAKSHPRGATGLSEQLGLQKRTFINKCNPNCEDHLLNVNDLVAIMQQTDDLQILKSLARTFGHVCVPIKSYTEYSDEALLDAWSDWDIERAETTKQIRIALDQGNMSPEQLDRIEQEMFEDFEKELAILNRLKGLVISK